MNNGLKGRYSCVADLTIEEFIFHRFLRNWSGFGIFVGDTTFELKKYTL